MTIEDLARPEIRDLHSYEIPVQVRGALRLHANEAPWSAKANCDSLNRYPELRPNELRSRLAGHFSVSRDNLLVTRGSTEAIDLLVRTFCRAGQDNIVITPPTFAMYQVYADIQGAGTINCPLLAEQDFAADADAINESCTANSKLILICSPNNPTGNVVPRPQIIQLLQARKGKSIIVVDEAYIEFSDTESMADLVAEYENLVILRTLSKAFALAGARCGAVIGNTALIRILNGVLAPYALSTPVIDCVVHALSSVENSDDGFRVREIIAERERIREQLTSNRIVQKVWPSQTNFLLVQFRDLATVQKRLQTEGILIRDLSSQPGLKNCARITVGSLDENNRLLSALHYDEDDR